MQKATLLLADGTVFHGQAGGMIGTTSGEICFNTGMTGYQEIFTDPSYFGQVLVATNVHIGNYGAKDSDTESEAIQIRGLICKDFNDNYSRSQADSDIQDYFEENKIVVISGVDTRALVRKIRHEGAMNVIISSETDDIDELAARLGKTPSMRGLELASEVSTSQSYEFGPEDADIRIAVFDYGTKRNILQCFADRGCRLKVFPAKASFEEVSEWSPDGYFLSNGPGDPASMYYAVANVKKILEEGKPTFGICLGHQILALAMNLETYKMHHGHRGINHPVKSLVSGVCEVTSQNHGFGVSKESILANEQDIEVTHMNLNDDTIEGIRLKNYPAFSIQYHPESSPGPHDSRYLFDEFIDLIKSHKS